MYIGQSARVQYSEQEDAPAQDVQVAYQAAAFQGPYVCALVTDFEWMRYTD